MNSSTLIGIGVALAMLAAAIFGSAPSAVAFINLPGLGIVLGGTIAALFIGYPISEIRRIPQLLRTVFRNENVDSQRDIDELVTLAHSWAGADVHNVERELQKVSNPFLRTGVQLIIDNTPEEQIVELLQWRIARMRAREQAEAQMFRTMASFAPAFGMLATLIGLVNLMTVLGSQGMDVIGKQMGIALIATFYGILLANLVCKPIAIKLERRTEQRLILMNMVLQGISMMCERRGPAMVRETLNSFMQHVEDEIREQPASRAGKNATGTRAAPSVSAAGTAPRGAASSAGAARTGAAMPASAAATFDAALRNRASSRS
ncbi:chemotaxis protein MotA [Bordetella genomosp. 10]|uniref:Chemotaxis protein MotA n=1 Tax=Bordetella genomosp. 10 TaxID=1416804 RepID=A0A261S1H3_9BORD|nr:MotA/TolQ/ExbB proton channel family protein [Bordetella genomosp. 10]OZI30847.1 chemotaxis protein MotA [Bordetella genomosp. 10]